MARPLTNLEPRTAFSAPWKVLHFSTHLLAQFNDLAWRAIHISLASLVDYLFNFGIEVFM